MPCEDEEVVVHGVSPLKTGAFRFTAILDASDAGSVIKAFESRLKIDGGIADAFHDDCDEHGLALGEICRAYLEAFTD